MAEENEPAFMQAQVDAELQTLEGSSRSECGARAPLRLS